METIFQNTTITASQLYQHFPVPFNRENTRTEPMLFQCEVMFGSPSSNCGGNGICKIVATDKQTSPVFIRTSCSHTRAFFISLGDGAGASLLFRRDLLCSNLVRRHFRHGILEMPEPCPVPKGLISALGLKMSELPAGLHLIEDHGKYLRINFQSVEKI